MPVHFICRRIGLRSNIFSKIHGTHQILTHKRLHSIQERSCKSLVYKSYGDPAKVVDLLCSNITENLGEGQVLCHTLASPINPADINQIQGVYPIKPSLPAIGGNEAVAEIIAAGPNSNRKVGDWVLPAQAGTGTWRSHFVCNENNLIQIPNDVSIPFAATLRVNPPTAYRLLVDYVDLQEGDTVIQNGANSAVGLCVIQLAKSMKLKTFNIVRDRPNIHALKDQLLGLGADIVITDAELSSERNVSKLLPEPAKLALNCVGGKQVMHLTKLLNNDAKLVTYGGMSRQPLSVPTAGLIFKNISLHGFWMSRWYSVKENYVERDRMLKHLTSLYFSGAFKEPLVENVSVDNYGSAIEKALLGSCAKQLLIF